MENRGQPADSLRSPVHRPFSPRTLASGRMAADTPGQPERALVVNPQLPGLAAAIGFILDRPYFIVTFNPVTLEEATAKAQFQAILDSIEEFPDYKVIFTKTSADTDGRVINLLIDDFVEAHADRSAGFTSLGTLRYLSAVKYADAVIGNSSSGILGVVHETQSTLLDHGGTGCLQVPVTDADLEHIMGLKSLRVLVLRNTKVTPEGVANLQEALPNYSILHDPVAPPHLLLLDATAIIPVRA